MFVILSHKVLGYLFCRKRQLIHGRGQSSHYSVSKPQAPHLCSSFLRLMHMARW